MLNDPSQNSLRLDLNIPNVMTAARVVLSGLVLFLLLKSEFLIGGVLLVIASLTDGVDGHFARRLGQATQGGALRSCGR